MALPSGYTKLEYIQSGGTQYIDTEFTPNQDTRVVMKTQYTQPSTATYLFGADAGSGQAGFSFGSANGNLRQFYNTTSTYFTSGLSFADPITVDANKNVCSIDDTYTVTGTYATFNPGYSMYLFAANRAGSVYGICTAAVYSCKIYNNGTLVRDFIPCKNASGIIGLWDDANSVFYENAGSGTFTAGPEVENGGGDDGSIEPAGDHNTNIGSVAREIEGGTVLIGGVLQEIEDGLVLVNGVSREISFGPSTYTVTIATAGNSDNLYLRIPGSSGTKYYNKATMEFEAGTEIYCYSRYTSTAQYLNGELVYSKLGGYTYTLTGNAVFNFSVNSGVAVVRVTME